MDVLVAIRKRRSIRKYVPREIPKEKLKTILKAAHLAPSAANRQPWRFMVVQDKDRKQALAEAANNQIFLKDASVIIAYVCGLRAPELFFKEEWQRSLCTRASKRASGSMHERLTS